MATDDVFPSDIDADAERFVDDEQPDPPTILGLHDEGSDADIIDQQRVVPIDDDA